MENIRALVELGEKMSLSGAKLQKWVDEMIKAEDSKKKEEEERKIAEKREEEQRKIAEEERKIAEKREEEQRKIAEEQRKIAEEKREIDSQARRVEMINKEMELVRLKTEKGVGVSGVNENNSARIPKLPPFDESESIHSFIIRFERFAVINKWDEQSWGTHLSALLTGKALETYSRLSDDEAHDYKTIKQALLERYHLTAEAFRLKFRNSRPETGERISQFKTRLLGYIGKWLELAEKSIKSSSDLIDSFLAEQLMSIASPALQTFVKERHPTSADKMVDFVERFIEAHGLNHAFVKPRHYSDVGKPPMSAGNKRGNVDPGASNSKDGHAAAGKFNTKAVAKHDKSVGCSFCGKRNHTEANCFKKNNRFESKVLAVTTGRDCEDSESPSMNCGCPVHMLTAACAKVTSGDSMPVALGMLNGKQVEVLRDSGCSCVVVKRDLVGPIDATAPCTVVHLAHGGALKVPVVQVTIDCPYYKGTVSAVVMEEPLYDVILGNIPEAKCPGLIVPDAYRIVTQIDNETEKRVDSQIVKTANAVETRNTKQNRVKLMKTPDTVDVGVSRRDLIEMQAQDESLEPLRKLATFGEVRKTGKANESHYGFDKGVLMRYFRSPKIECGNTLNQVVVPEKLRSKVMKLGHECILAGHLAAKKTTDRILSNFYWSNIWSDVSRYCQSCDQCQRSVPKGRVTKVPMEQLPIIDEPFSRIAIDLIGPIQPASERGHRYILTAVDFSTRYPEAVALKGIETERVAEALVEIFSRVGLPKEILSDRGSQFTSDLMKEICRLLSIKQLITSPYHPQCNGLVEKFNGTLKMMLKKMTSERPRDWDRYIPAALFAYREAPQESLGFSPFELLYGRTLRGPMAILKELWTEEETDSEVKTTYQYVVDLKNRLEQTMSLAQTALRKATNRYKKNFDRKTRQRRFDEGSKVLLLLPTAHNKLELKWQGPFDVLKALGHNNYRLKIKDQERTYHVNMLKQYYERREENAYAGILQCAAAAVIPECEDADEMGEGRGASGSGVKVEMPCLTQSETWRDVSICDSLNTEKQTELHDMLKGFNDVLTDVPGRTDWIRHDIRLTSNDPIRKRPYPVPQAFKETMREEVDKMIEADIIEPSYSPYSSPSVIVKKKDGSNRYCIDFRALNNVSIFDAEPMPRPDDLFREVGSHSRYLTKIDLSKGYWQICLSEEAKRLTAFATEKGLYQFKVMPFGLQGAPATFSRLMRKVTAGLPNVHNYLDDCLVHTESWDEHLVCLKALLTRLREAGLTAKPSKCQMAFSELEFLGHMVGSGKLFPTLDKVEAMRDASPPKTKKEMRSFLGLASFYRRYVPNFAAISCPLSDATKKGKPNAISWEAPLLRAYKTLKAALTCNPVLRLPDFNKSFLLQTDASDKGLGAILLQEHDGAKFPVIFLSRKLTAPEKNYSVIEKECLALVWAVKSLDTYLQGREFVILTDHAPLLYLNKAKSDNGRLMRWALLLHQYRFRIESVKGKDNHGPDFLSRI